MTPDPDIAETLAEPEDALFERLGAQLVGEAIGVGPDDRERHRRFGKRWFEQWIELNRQTICSDPRVVAITADGPHAKSVEEYAVILDVISPLLGTPPVATVAFILAKRGLSRICADRDAPEL